MTTTESQLSLGQLQVKVAGLTASVEGLRKDLLRMSNRVGELESEVNIMKARNGTKSKK